jgi:hypothetical protein
MKFIHQSGFCQNCGENISREIAFCRSCGTALSEEQVQANIERSRDETSVHVSVHDENKPVLQKIAGAVLIGLMEFLFITFVFTLSLLISINFLPALGDDHSGSLFSYFIVMATACIAGLVGGSFLSKKLCEKYPNPIAKMKSFLYLEEKPPE